MSCLKGESCLKPIGQRSTIYRLTGGMILSYTEEMG